MTAVRWVLAGAAVVALATGGCAGSGTAGTAASGGPAVVAASTATTATPAGPTAAGVSTGPTVPAAPTGSSPAPTVSPPASVDGGASSAPSPTRSSIASSGPAPVTASTTAPVDGSTGCPTTGGGVPAGAERRTTIDVDGDGRPDVLWIRLRSDGTAQIGVTTASGATFDTVYRSASPDPRSVLLARPTPTAQPVLLVSDGRSVDLETVFDCAIHQVTNPQGGHYTFDVGFTGYGTGVGCLGPGDRPGLTGLNAPVPADRRHYTITRTFVVLRGATARNGTQDVLHATLPADRRLVDSARTVTCGRLTLQQDGLSVTD